MAAENTVSSRNYMYSKEFEKDLCDDENRSHTITSNSHFILHMMKLKQKKKVCHTQ